MSELNYEECSPTLDGYKTILRALKENENPTKDQVRSIEQLEKYINSQESKQKEV